jgi:hypothetical protein
MSTEPPDHPDDLARIDREIRLNEVWHEADELAREQVREAGLWGEEAEMAIETWRDLYAYDTAPDSSQHEIFRAEGIELPPPEDLDDAALTAKLWEVIQALVARNTFLSSTDHLSNRELYTHLVTETFHQITKDIVAPGWNHQIDIVGGCSEEDIELQLRYYVGDEERARWLESFPDYVLPPKEKPPYDRDRHLPNPRYQ